MADTEIAGHMVVNFSLEAVKISFSLPFFSSNCALQKRCCFVCFSVFVFMKSMEEQEEGKRATRTTTTPPFFLKKGLSTASNHSNLINDFCLSVKSFAKGQYELKL